MAILYIQESDEQSTSEVEDMVDEASELPEGQFRVERLIAKRKTVPLSYGHVVIQLYNCMAMAHACIARHHAAPFMQHA